MKGRVLPARGDIQDRAQHECPQMRPRVRQNRRRHSANGAVEINNVQIQCARLVHRAARAAGVRFDCVQRFQKLGAINSALQPDNAVTIIRLAGRRDRGSAIPIRLRFKRQTWYRFNRRDRALAIIKSITTGAAWQVGAYRNENHK